MREWIAHEFRTFRKFYHWWRDHLTSVGKSMFLVMLYCLPALTASDSVLAIVFLASFTALLVTGVTNYLHRPRLTIKASCPPAWMRWQQREIRMEVTNRSARSVYEMQLDFVHQPDTWEFLDAIEFIEILRPGESIALSFTIKPLRRGLHKLPRLRATTLFPLHIVRITTTYSIQQEMLILPAYRELTSCNLAQIAHGLTRGNEFAMRSVGLTGEYVGSREYQPGMPVRRWDYPSWARLGQPVVREYSRPQEPCVALILDTFFTDEEHAEGDLIPELEAILSLAAAITEAFIDRGCHIAVMAVGDTVIRLADRFSADDQQAILAYLAVAKPSCSTALPEFAYQLTQTRVVWDLAVLLCHQWDAEREKLLQAVTRQSAIGKSLLVYQDGHLRDKPRLSDAATPLSMDRVSVSQIEAGTVGI